MTFAMVDQWQQQFDLHLCATSDYFSYTTPPAPEQHSQEVLGSHKTPSPPCLGEEVLVKAVAAPPSVLINDLGYQPMESYPLCSMLDDSLPPSLPPSSGPTSSFGDCLLISPTSSTASSWVDRSSCSGTELDAGERFEVNGVISLPMSQITPSDSLYMPSLVSMSGTSSKVVPMQVENLSLPPISPSQECYNFLAADISHSLVSEASELNNPSLEKPVSISEYRGLCCATHLGNHQRCDHTQADLCGSPRPPVPMEYQPNQFRQQKRSYQAKMESSNSSRVATVNAKRFTCPECGQRFARAFNLQTHVSTHAGLRPFSCPAAGCSKAFSRRHDLGRHLNAVHRDWLVTNDLSATEAIKPAPRKSYFKKAHDTYLGQSASAAGR